MKFIQNAKDRQIMAAMASHLSRDYMESGYKYSARWYQLNSAKYYALVRKQMGIE